MSIRLLVGLGNPEQAYQGHRHNFGFMLLNAVVNDHSARWHKAEGGLVAEVNVSVNGGLQKVFLLKPQEFMNRSGRATGALARYYDIAAADTLVVYDELDLPLGKVRYRLGGGAGGHNGVKDVMRHLPEDFHRLRLGIGHPGDKHKVHGYVLSNFAKAEESLKNQVIAEAVRYLDLLVAKNFVELMNRLAHLAPTPPKED